MHGGFHSKSGTVRLSTKQKEGGMELVSISPSDELLNDCLRQLQPRKGEKEEEEG